MLLARAGLALSGDEGMIEGIGEALRRNQGGFSTRLHLRAEGGKPITVVLAAGERHEQYALDPLRDKGTVPRHGSDRPRLRPRLTETGVTPARPRVAASYSAESRGSLRRASTSHSSPASTGSPTGSATRLSGRSTSSSSTVASPSAARSRQPTASQWSRPPL